MKPQYEPTDEDAPWLKTLRRSASVRNVWLGIDEKTLRKHFRAELDNGMFKAHMAIGKGIFLMATQSSDEKVRADMSKYYASRQMPNFPLLARASLSRAMRSGK